MFGDDFEMVLTAYCKQRIVQLYFDRRIWYGKVARFLATEGFRATKQIVWAFIQNYKEYGTISCLPESGRPFKLTPEMLEATEERMKQDDETTVAQLVKPKRCIT